MNLEGGRRGRPRAERHGFVPEGGDSVRPLIPIGRGFAVWCACSTPPLCPSDGKRPDAVVDVRPNGGMFSGPRAELLHIRGRLVVQRELLFGLVAKMAHIPWQPEEDRVRPISGSGGKPRRPSQLWRRRTAGTHRPRKSAWKESRVKKTERCDQGQTTRAGRGTSARGNEERSR